MAILKQSTVYQRQFLLVKASDHISPSTGQTTSITMVLYKGGGTSSSTCQATISECGNGFYSASYTPADTNTIGDMAVAITSTSADPAAFIDQVQTNVFSDLLITSGGRIYINDNLLQNTALPGFTFMMVDSVTGQRKSGLSVTAQRTLGGGGFAACSNSVSEIAGTGIYSLSLTAADVNNATVGFLFTATGASDVFMPLVTTP